MKTLIKICGIKDIKTAELCCKLGADALGFVFCKSIRKLEPEEARSIIDKVPQEVLKIGVFMNNDLEEVKWIKEYCGLDIVQLHGDEDADYCNSLNSPYIKAFKPNKEDFERMKEYNCYGFLVDSPKDFSGAMLGKVFDWEVVKYIPQEIKDKIILAGGLNASNVISGIKEVAPFMVDVSSGVETNRVKDEKKIKEFIRKVREFEGDK